MGLHLIESGTAQPRIEVMLRSNNTGQGATDILAANISACTWQVDGQTTITDITLADAAYPPVYGAGKWSAVDPTRKPGAYLLDLPTAMVAAGNKGKVITVRLCGSGFLDAKETILVGPLSARAVEMIAGLIDPTVAPNLDVAVSSRAPANTALSNTDLTLARIQKLDNLDATVSSRVSAADLTVARIQRLDNLDATVASRAPANTAVSSTDLTPGRIAKLDNLDATVGSAKAAGDAAKTSADLAASAAGSAASAATAASEDASAAMASAADSRDAAQAAADRAGQIAAVTAKLDTMLVLNGQTYQLTAAALALSPSAGALTVLPLATTVSTSLFTTSGGNLLNLVHAQNSRATYSFAVFDGEDNPVDLSAKDLELAVHTAKGAVKFTVRTGAGVVVGGASGNQVSVTVSETQASEAGLFYYKLWNLTDRRLLASGSFRIPLAPVVLP